MGDVTKIEWCDHTFNPWRGCTKVSPGCEHCYAEAGSKRNPAVLGTWGPKGKRVVAAESYWRQPIAWNREAAEAGERRRVFCASLADVFEDWQGPMVDSQGRWIVQCDSCDNTDGSHHWDFVPPISKEKYYEHGCGEHLRPLTMSDARERLFRLIQSTPNLDWLLLTKRPENIPAMMAEFLNAWNLGYLPNVWLGVSVEDQKRADERIPRLLRTPAAVRFLSCEPLLSEVNLWQWLHESNLGIHWVICGGESGPRARPLHPEWARTLRYQCQRAGVPFFFKQWGEWTPISADQHAKEYTRACKTEDWSEVHKQRLLNFPRGEYSDVDLSIDATPYMGRAYVKRVGKKAAGRMLDGREWDEFPEPAHA